MTPRRVALLKGGPSLERQVSMRSAARVEDALERLDIEHVSVDVGGTLLDDLRAADADVAFVALHGRGGEDGTVQELLEIVGIPYTGSGVLACMRCMDKVLTKHMLREVGLPTPDFFAFSEIAFKELGAGEALPAIEERLGFPMVVKPAAQGSALGIKFARDAADVPEALIAAFSYDDRVLLERHVEGRELAVSLLEGAAGVEALPIVEAKPRQEYFFDFEARYEIGKTDFACPAELPDDVTARAQELAVETYRLLGCYGFARVDMILSPTGDPQVLEAQAIPGLTETSLLPQAAEAAGISFEQLVARMLEQALARTAQQPVRT
ncbi:MAG: D-alanine--D-alanine ligase family protein [Solirubrobacterales bacterium]